MSNFELEENFREWWGAQGYVAKPNSHTVNIATAWASTFLPPEPAGADGPAVPEGREPASVTMQSTNMPDWRGLCEELLSALNGWHQAVFETGISWVKPDETYLIDRARAALAQPEPEVVGPTDEEVEVWADAQGFIRGHGDHPCGFWIDDGDAGALVRAALARWGTPNLAETRSSLGDAPAPVPVSERLPGPEDCDAEGRCWLLTVEDEYPQWRLHSIEGSQPGGSTMVWVPVDSSPGVMVDAFYASHWLPFNALPLPQGEVE